MNFTIAECSCQSILIKQSYSDSLHSEEIEEQKFRFDKVEFSTSVFDQIGILSIVSSEENKAELCIQTTGNLLMSCFVFSGKITSENSNKPGKFQTLSKGKHNLCRLPPSTIYSSAEASFEGMMIFFSEKFIQKLLPGDSGVLETIGQDTKNDLSDSLLAITPAMYHLIQAIALCDYKNYMKRIFSEAKVLELLFNQLEQANQQHKKTSQTLKKYDIEKIYTAKKLVEENLQNPCSLIELAHKVGINDFKLKKGFKEILGNTVFGYLFDLRMEKARLMLTERKSVSEVAHEVGYKNPHHFTSAFKKKFGILPSELNK